MFALLGALVQGQGLHCLACHESVDSLKKYAVEEPEIKGPSEGGGLKGGCGGKPPPLKKWQKLRVSKAFLSGPMGQLGCVKCHGGRDTADFKLAHEGLIPDPSEPGKGREPVCAECHGDIVKHYKKSLHFTVYGQAWTLEVRSGTRGIADSGGCLYSSYRKDCYTCHASCGDCHVSRPKPVKGGLLASHQFLKKPPMKDVCGACHAARTYGEYTGNFGYPADVHWAKGLKECTYCHGADELHGMWNASDRPDSNMHLNRGPKCEDCHAKSSRSNEYHKIHWGKVQCNVCHSMPIRHCFTCHTGYFGDVEDPAKFYRYPEEQKFLFKIGYNAFRDQYHPWRYTQLRHPPNSPHTFDWFKEHYCPERAEVFPHFSALPTWKPGTGHNVQRRTPQTESCWSCHDNPKVWLTEADLKDYEREANAAVINAFRTVFPLPRWSWAKLLGLAWFGFLGLLLLHGIGTWTGRAIARRREK